ncbi:MAG TPA: hypothetical protein ENI27_06020 [bacterium]|nr:hypothetical protein [bacterium]
MNNPTTQNSSELEELLGLRARLQANIKTRRLSSVDQRMVLFAGQPVGIIQRRPGSMCWFSTARTLPFYSIADAAISLVGEVFHAGANGGREAVEELLQNAKEAAAKVSARLDDEDAPEDQV